MYVEPDQVLHGVGSVGIKHPFSLWKSGRTPSPYELKKNRF